MSRHFEANHFHVAVAGLLAMLLGSSGDALQRYSVQAGQNACASFDECTVYDDAGRHEVACFQPAGEAPQAFAGDFGWPLSTATCKVKPSTSPSAG